MILFRGSVCVCVCVGGVLLGVMSAPSPCVCVCVCVFPVPAASLVLLRTHDPVCWLAAVAGAPCLLTLLFGWWGVGCVGCVAPEDEAALLQAFPSSPWQALLSSPRTAIRRRLTLLRASLFVAVHYLRDLAERLTRTRPRPHAQAHGHGHAHSQGHAHAGAGGGGHRSGAGVAGGPPGTGEDGEGSPFGLLWRQHRVADLAAAVQVTGCVCVCVWGVCVRACVCVRVCVWLGECGWGMSSGLFWHVGL
jgi:hypothetical protein